MFATIKQDRKLQALLIFCFLIQICFSYIQVGFFHPDQHFQIIEFSSYQLGKPSFAKGVWEFDAQIRPTIQVYIFSGFRWLCNCLHITNNFIIVKILQIITGILMFVLFNAMALFYARQQSKKVLYWVIIMLNLSWGFAYERSLYSSETYGALFFFTGVFYFQASRVKSLSVSVLTGLLLGLGFYARFQMAFAIVGFGVWLLFIEKCYKQIFWISIGFIIAFALNMYLDKLFYHNWVCTPYNYYKVNVLQGKANSFGTTSFTYYIAILAAIVLAPLYSLVLFGVAIKSSFKNFRHPLVLIVFFFVAGHCLIGHKEERFLYPIFCILPMIIGLQLQSYFDYYEKSTGFVKGLLGFFKWFGLVLNSVLLIIFICTPYAQTVYFDECLQNRFGGNNVDIYYVDRNSLETESHLQLKFYEESLSNVHFNKISSIDTLRDLHGVKKFISMHNQLDIEKQRKLDSLGFKQVITSSKILWKVNDFLRSKKANTISDVWMLYER